MSKTRILESVRKLDLETTRDLVRREPSLLNVTDAQGRNLLLHACSVSCGTSKVPEQIAAMMVAFLLDSGLDVDSMVVMEEYPCNSVWFAVARGRNRTVVELLLRRGAAPHGLFAAGWYDDVEMIELLLRAGATIDEMAEDETPFLHCWKHQRFRAATHLIRRGANVNFQDSKGKTALHYAIEKDFDPDRVRFLIDNGALPDIEDRNGVSPRLKAARKRDKRFVQVFA